MLKGFPCQTPAVERAIKAVSAAGEHVCGQDRLDGFVRATLKSRALVPKFESKRDYK